MKIEVEIPDRPEMEDQIIHIFLGMEHMAVKRPGYKWVIKDKRCSMCGSCCTIHHTRNLRLPMDEDTGICKLLAPHPLADKDPKYKDKKICAWKNNRPFNCCIGAPTFEPKCTVTWKEEGDVDKDKDTAD